MAEQVSIDDKYACRFEGGKVTLLRHGEIWIEDPEASKAWIAAAEEIRHLRAQLAISAS